MLLLSQDYGKHLLGVEDLLQKHALVEADIGIQADRVRNVNRNAQKFAIDTEGETDRQTDRYFLFLLAFFLSSFPFLSSILDDEDLLPLPPQVTNPVTLRSSGTG